MAQEKVVDPSTVWLEERMRERMKAKFDPRWIISVDLSKGRSRSRSLSRKRVEVERTWKSNPAAKSSADPKGKPVNGARNSDSWQLSAPPGIDAPDQAPVEVPDKKKKKKAESDGEDSVYEWREKVPSRCRQAEAFPMEESSDEEVGPMPLNQTSKTMISQAKGSYGGYLLAGEGDAMANFVQSNQRIPRRGEVGIKAEEIEQLEDLGFVMSGSRHRRMNAVRIRKENQVYSAEEKRALAMYQFEEKANRETALITDLREMLNRRQQTISEQGAGSSEDPRFESTGEQKRFI